MERARYHGAHSASTARSGASGCGAMASGLLSLVGRPAALMLSRAFLRRDGRAARGEPSRQRADLRGLDVVVRRVPIEEAKKRGTQLFGEKIRRDVVRGTTCGGWSVELGWRHACGQHGEDRGPSPHHERDAPVAWVRRIEAVTGQAFLDQVDRYARLVRAGVSVLEDDAGVLPGQG